MTFDYDKLAAFSKIVIEYSGSNDEGYIGEIRAEPRTHPRGELPGVEYGTELYKELEAAAYNLLQENFGGWETNEGSHGEITINVKERQVYLHHGRTIESTQWEDVELPAEHEPPAEHYEPPEDLADTVFDPHSETFGPIMAAIQAGEFGQAAGLLTALEEEGPSVAGDGGPWD